MKRWLLMFLLAVSAAQADSPNSIYNLNVALTDQAGAAQKLDVYRGHPVLITMFYGSCPMACPLLIDTIRATERALDPKLHKDLRVLLVSIDPEHDTVAALQSLATGRKIDTTRWTLARTDAANVRKLAAVLGIQYRELPTGGFNHSSIVTALDAGGNVRYQSSVLGKADPEIVAVLQTSVKNASAQR